MPKKSSRDPRGPQSADKPAFAGKSPADRDSGRSRVRETGSHAHIQQEAAKAEALIRGFIPTCMSSALAGTGAFDPATCRGYLDRFLKDAGDPHDPVERILLEQMALAHLRLGDLHVCAAKAKAIEAIKIYTAGSARLLSELRRLALALKAYRERTPATQKLRLVKAG